MFRVDRIENEGADSTTIGLAPTFGAVLGLVKRHAGVSGEGTYSVYRVGVRERIWGWVTLEQGLVFTIKPDISDGNWPDALE